MIKTSFKSGKPWIAKNPFTFPPKFTVIIQNYTFFILNWRRFAVVSFINVHEDINHLKKLCLFNKLLTYLWQFITCALFHLRNCREIFPKTLTSSTFGLNANNLQIQCRLYFMIWFSTLEKLQYKKLKMICMRLGT